MSSGPSHGLSCCGSFLHWRDMIYEVHPDGPDGLAWIWSCPYCGQPLRTDPFVPPVLDYQP